MGQMCRSFCYRVFSLDSRIRVNHANPLFWILRGLNEMEEKLWRIWGSRSWRRNFGGYWRCIRGCYDVLFKKHACIFSFTYTVVLRQSSLTWFGYTNKVPSFKGTSELQKKKRATTAKFYTKRKTWDTPSLQFHNFGLLFFMFFRFQAMSSLSDFGQGGSCRPSHGTVFDEVESRPGTDTSAPENIHIIESLRSYIRILL